MTPAPIRILIADDHPIVRDGLALMLGTQPDFEVVGEAANGLDVFEIGHRLQPDIILLDLQMPDMDGLETMRRLRQVCPGVRVLVFTAFDSDDRIVGAVQAGAKGYLLKGAPRQEIFNAIRVVAGGGSLLQPVIAERLMQQLAHPPAEPDALTEREHEVLSLLAQGKTNREIAEALVITERTVKFHISAILGKLGAGNRTDAVRLAVQRGLVSLKSD